MSLVSIHENTICFQFKASFSPCTILQLTQYNLELLEKQIERTVSRAPNIFLGTPVVIDLEKMHAVAGIDFARLKTILMKAGLAPMGVRGGTLEQTTLAATLGLPLVNVGKTATAIPLPDESIEPEKVEPKVVDEAKPVKAATKIVTQPIRSGMQVYAKESDLIIVGHVSSGAELLADGNIHVYGALRGRALAGLSGNTQARIFCRTLEAELVSIAGFYLTKEDMQSVPPSQSGMIQIYLDNEQVRIEPI